VLRDPELFGADEVFLTSTTREIVPVVAVDDRTIGNSRPGSVTKACCRSFERRRKA
jgi:branched-subunit amino acid aminotransferase/4-amino-4-deoxychorismate lyase